MGAHVAASQHTYDVALIQLDCSVTFSRYLAPVALPKADDSLQNSDGTTVYVAGWGDTTGADSTAQ